MEVDFVFFFLSFFLFSAFSSSFLPEKAIMLRYSAEDVVWLSVRENLKREAWRMGIARRKMYFYIQNRKKNKSKFFLHTTVFKNFLYNI